MNKPAFKQPAFHTLASPQRFISARNRSSRVGYFTPYKDTNELSGYTLLLSLDGSLGAAVSPTGNIESVFNNSGVKGAGAAAIEAAKAYGGKTLDVFGDALAKIYARHGFVETGRAKFDPALAPPLWNTERDGTPDVIFMELRP